jgi:hypothetical protein
MRFKVIISGMPAAATHATPRSTAGVFSRRIIIVPDQVDA